MPTRHRSRLPRRAVLQGAAASAISLQFVRAESATPIGSPSASPVAAAETLDNGAEVIRSAFPHVPTVYLTAPKPWKSYEGTPVSGGKLAWSHLIYGPPATPRDKNAYWKEMEKRLGLEEFAVSEIPVGTYGEKLSAVIASADMGDLMFLNPLEGGGPIINKALAEGAFVDLTDHLSGENLKKYKNLAAIPADAWEQSRFNGKTFGVPNPLFRGANLTFVREDWQSKLGIAPPTNLEQLEAMYEAFTKSDPDGNSKNDTWATAGTYTHLYYQLFRCPQIWRRNDDGSLTHMYETPEYRQFLDFRRKAVEKGWVHPDAAAGTQADQRELVNTSRVGTMSEGFNVWWGENGMIESVKTYAPEAKLMPILPFGYDGGHGTVFPVAAYYGINAIPVTSNPSPERIDEILRVCDYLFPPFGSEEDIFLADGIEGTHHTVSSDGVRQRTDQGDADIAELLYSFGAHNDVLYYPGFNDHAIWQQQLIEYMLPIGQPNPVQGIYSEKDATLAPTATKPMIDATSDYVLGRAEGSAIDNAIEAWRSGGGDDIRADYERLLKELGR